MYARILCPPTHTVSRILKVILRHRLYIRILRMIFMRFSIIVIDNIIVYIIRTIIRPNGAPT